MWVAVEFPARISKVNAEFPVLLHFRTPLLLLMTHHEKTWLNESFTVVLTLTLGGGGVRESAAAPNFQSRVGKLGESLFPPEFLC